MSASALHPVTTGPEAVSPAKTAFASTYRGTDKIIARTSAGALSEQEFFLYLVMTGQDDPRLLEHYRFVESDLEEEKLRERITKVVESWTLTKLMAGQDNTSLDVLDATKEMQLLYPVYELVWIDRELAPDIKVVEEDIVKLYREKPAEVLAKPRATVRYILIKVDSHNPAPNDIQNLPDDKWRGAYDKMQNIRDDAVLNPDTFSELAKQHSQAPSGQLGGKVAFSKGTFFKAFEEAAFSLGENQISSIIPGPGGLYLIQAVSTTEGEVLPLNDLVHAKLRRVLALKQIKHRYAFEMNKMKKAAFIKNYAKQIREIESDDAILTVNQWTLSRSMAWQLFPEFVQENFQLNTNWLSAKLNKISDYELQRQTCVNRGWENDAMLTKGRELARMLVSARDACEAHAASTARVDFQKIRKFLQSRPQAFPFPKPTKQKETQPGLRMMNEIANMPQPLIDALLAGPADDFIKLTRPRISLVRVSIRQNERLSPERHKWELDQMRAYMNDAVTRCKAIPLETLAAESLTRHHHPAELPARFVADELRLVATDLSNITFWTSDDGIKTLDKVTRNRVLEVKRTMDNWTEMGVRFLPILETSRSLSLFCVEQPDYRSDAIAEYLSEKFWDFFIQTKRITYIENLRSDKVVNKMTLALPEKQN